MTMANPTPTSATVIAMTKRANATRLMLTAFSISSMPAGCRRHSAASAHRRARWRRRARPERGTQTDREPPSVLGPREVDGAQQRGHQEHPEQLEGHRERPDDGAGDLDGAVGRRRL